MDFLLQARDGIVTDIDVFAVMDVLKRYRIEGHSYLLTDDSTALDGYKERVPVGTIDFVEKHLKHFHGVPHLKPIDVPEQLRLEKYLMRDYKIIQKKDLPQHGNWHIKYTDRIKTFCATMWTSPDWHRGLDEGNYIVSSVVDIVSEYRTFVNRGKLVGIKHYDGDFKVFPDVKRLEEMIAVYTESPLSYTLDVAILANGHTVLLEIHNFTCVGLYGFEEREMLYMYKNGYEQELKAKAR